MKKGILIIFVIALVAIAIYNNISQNEQTQDQNTNGANGSQSEVPVESNKEELPEQGFRAPSFTLEGLDGKTYSLHDIDKPKMLNFWASWCPPCRAEAPEMARLYKKYGDKVEIVAVNLTVQDEVTKAQQFVDEFGFTFPIPLDQDGKVADMYRVQAIPTSYFIDKDGIIIRKVVGLVPPEEMENLFKQLAEE